MSIVHTESHRFEEMERVAELTLQGLSATAISKRLEIPRKEVLTLQEDYRIALSQDTEARDMARDYLNQMVKHYDSLISKFYDLVDEIESLNFNHQVAAQKNAALKAIADLESRRLDSLQKAGILDSSELGDELAKWEEDKEMLLTVLNDLCPACQATVGDRLNKLRGGKVEPIEVEVVE